MVLYTITLISFWSVAVYGILKSNYMTINILTGFIFFQNIILVVVSPYISEMQYNLIVFTKEFYVILVILYFFRKRRILKRFDLMCTAYILALFLIALVHSVGEANGVFASLRQLYLPFLFYILGQTVDITEDSIDKIISFFIKISVFSVIFGIIEMIIGDQFWGIAGIQTYAGFKSSDQYIYGGNIVPASFYSFDFYPIIPRVRRMASILVDPVIMGQLLSIAFILVVFHKKTAKTKRMRVTYGFILGLGLILTFAKGGIIIGSICFLFLIDKLWNKKIISILGKLGAVVIGVRYFRFGIINDLSIARHMQGLLDGIFLLQQSLFGVGIGGFGNLGTRYGGVERLGIGESFIGAAVGQIGIIAVIIYISFYYGIFRKLKLINTELSYIMLLLNITLLLTAFVNNTAISFTNCYIFFVLASLCINVYKKKDTNMKIQKTIEKTA